MWGKEEVTGALLSLGDQPMIQAAGNAGQLSCPGKWQCCDWALADLDREHAAMHSHSPWQN